METAHLDKINIIGIAIRTVNRDQQSVRDIAMLWERFWSENVVSAIPEKIGNDIYCIYTDYEGDFTQPYTALIGCPVASLPDKIPAGLTGLLIKPGKYAHLTARGKLSEGAVVKVWEQIWKSDLDRVYQADFEVYGAKASDPENAEVDVYAGIRQD